MVGVVCKGTVKRNQVALGQQLIQGDIFCDPLQGRIFMDIIGKDFHAETMADPHHSRSDLSGSHDSRRFLIKVKSHQASETEVIFPYFNIRFVEPPVDRQRQSHGMFSHGFRRISGYAQNADAKPVYCVLSGGLIKLLFEMFHHFIGSAALDEKTFDFRLGQSGRFWQIFLLFNQFI